MTNHRDIDPGPAGATLCLPLTTEGLALEVGSALDPSPPFLVPALARLVARLRAREPREAAT